MTPMTAGLRCKRPGRSTAAWHNEAMQSATGATAHSIQYRWMVAACQKTIVYPATTTVSRSNSRRVSGRRQASTAPMGAPSSTGRRQFSVRKFDWVRTASLRARPPSPARSPALWRSGSRDP